WLWVAESSGDAASIAMVRAGLCGESVEQMRADAEAAAAELTAADRRQPEALLLLGTAQALCGEDASGEATLERAVASATMHGASVAELCALAQRALIAADHNDEEAADRFALAARELLVRGAARGTAVAALAAAVCARALLRLCRWDDARAALAMAESLE